MTGVCFSGRFWFGRICKGVLRSGWRCGGAFLLLSLLVQYRVIPDAFAFIREGVSGLAYGLSKLDDFVKLLRAEVFSTEAIGVGANTGLLCGLDNLWVGSMR